MHSSSHVTVSVTRITGTIFETLNNQDKSNQSRIVVAGVYFALCDSVCDVDGSFRSADIVQKQCSTRSCSG